MRGFRWWISAFGDESISVEGSRTFKLDLTLSIRGKLPYHLVKAVAGRSDRNRSDDASRGLSPSEPGL